MFETSQARPIAPPNSGSESLSAGNRHLTVGAAWWLVVIACALLVLGAKLWLITKFASPTPYWDQWDAEAALLYDPHLTGGVPLSTWFSPHTEHRLLLTRLLALVLLEFAGQWDVVLQMYVNAGLHAGVLVLVLYLLQDLVGYASGITLAIFSALILMVPFGWENTLSGFGNQFYLLMMFSVFALACILGAPANSFRWWCGVALSGASFFCMASGAFTPLAGAAVSGMQIIARRRRGPYEFVGVTLLLILSGILIHSVPTLEQHAPLRAHSITQYLGAFWETAGWPLPVSFVVPFILFAPLITLAIRAVLGSITANAAVWLCLGIGIWVLAQHASLAYARALGIYASRYLDLKSLGLIVNFAAMIANLQASTVTFRRWSIVVPLLSALWLMIVGECLGHTALTSLTAKITEKSEEGRIETENLRLFLNTGDVTTLQGKAGQAIPYPNADRLAKLASLPTIRGLLPVELVDDPAAREAITRRLWMHGRLSRVAGWVHRSGALLGPYIVFLGVGMLFAVGLFASRPPRQP
jgi:hypothetical protein